MRTRLAESHDAALAPLPPLDLGIFAAAGALRSTARDLARFAAAILPGSESRFAKMNAALLSIQRPAVWAPWAPSVRGKQALGWEVRTAPGGPFLNKDGVTDGQTASFVVDTTQPLAVIVLSNTSADLRSSTLSGGGIGAADIAQHLLRPEIPLGGQGGAIY
jgi:serine-type D-Ala-D-Ala carboxypeptidase/endopeptidase